MEIQPHNPENFHPCISGPQIIKLFSCSNQLSIKFKILIKIKILKNKVFLLSNSQMYLSC